MQPPPPEGQLGGNGLRATQGQRRLRPRPGWQCQGPHDLPTVGSVPAAQPVAMRDMRGSGWSPVPQCHPLGRVLLALRLPKLVGAAPWAGTKDKAGGATPAAPSPGWHGGRRGRGRSCSPAGLGRDRAALPMSQCGRSIPGLRWGLGFVFLQRDKSSNLFPAFGSWVGRWKRHVAKDGEETPAQGDLARQSPAPLGNHPP